ncbi:NAD-dependent epimerase/dehydratase family protein [Roseicyclus persicicus]|uniref:NAD-dependent epimerase/dehydratase family protein n=1 Tax=Roseicyclus persicicus TaxID=2650661 RepID=A0A7X6H235_9RHOB|nr:NAD-dependent epimerase/dehydratase family protein [Roseibacterium persicicum]NKX45337.1 NAD-dependent epimerase/dehydratase family protein [Roseibacterium persicicum]
MSDGLVLVTGGAGFIGSHLAPQLVALGRQVRVLDTLSPQVHGQVPGDNVAWLTTTPGVEFRRGSAGTPADLRSALEGVSAVVHLAAETGTGQSMYEIARYCRQNVQATALLMDLIANDRSLNVERVVLASSRSVYGEGAYVRCDTSDGARLTPPTRSAEALRAGQWEPVCPDTGAPLQAVPTREDDRTAPASIYAATKLMQEDLVRIGCAAAGVGYAILRLQNVYGEGQSLANPYTGILSIFSTRIRRGLELPVFEDGLESRDFVHVSDVSAAFVAAVQAQQVLDTVVNVGSGVATPVIEVARSLCRAFSAPEKVHVTGQYRVGDIRHNMADVSVLRRVLKVDPQVQLDDGLKRFSRWVTDQPLHADRLDEANAELVKRGMMG